MWEVKNLTEDQRWEQFARELGALLDGTPDHVEQLVQVVRHREARNDVFNWAIKGVFPRLTLPQRVQFAQTMRVLAH